MKRLGIRALQQNASRVVREAARGTAVEVTDHGRAVALLLPIPSGDLRKRLAAAGRIRLAEGDLLRLGEPLPRPRGKLTASKRLLDARAAER